MELEQVMQNKLAEVIAQRSAKSVLNIAAELDNLGELSALEVTSEEDFQDILMEIVSRFLCDPSFPEERRIHFLKGLKLFNAAVEAAKKLPLKTQEEQNKESHEKIRGMLMKLLENKEFHKLRKIEASGVPVRKFLGDDYPEEEMQQEDAMKPKKKIRASLGDMLKEALENSKN